MTRSKDYTANTYGRNSLVYGLQPPSHSSELLISFTKFQQLVREKENWALKAADMEYLRALAEKEGLLADEKESERSRIVLGTLRDIQVEAQRIVDWDFQVHIPRNFTHPLAEEERESAIAQQTSFTVDYLQTSLYGIATASLKEELNVYFIDGGVVPDSLRGLLAAELASITRGKPRDIAPDTHGALEHIIDPFLYTRTLSRLHDQANRSSVVIGKAIRLSLKSFFSQVPATFRVSDDGTDVRITSPIIALGPRDRHPRLYFAIESVFRVALPLLERVYEFTHTYKDSPSVLRWKARTPKRYMRVTEEAWEELIQEQAEEKERDIKQAESRLRELEERRKESILEHKLRLSRGEGSVGASSWNGKDLPVIVKAFNIVLKPGQCYEDWWQHQAFPHEGVAASIFYFYEIEPCALVEANMSFRRYRDIRFDPPQSTPNSKVQWQHFLPKDRTLKVLLWVMVKDFVRAHRGSSIHSAPIIKKRLSSARAATLPKDYPSDREDEESCDVDASPKTETWFRGKPYILQGEVPLSVKIGAGEGTTDRMIAFPSWLQTKIRISAKPNSDDGSGSGKTTTVKCICLLLVDNSTAPFSPFPQPETSKLPTWPSSQVYYHANPNQPNLFNRLPLPASMLPSPLNLGTAHFLLPYICRKLTGTNLPAELVDMIYNDAKIGKSREEAERDRWHMRNERKVSPDHFLAYGDDAVWSLCK